MEGYPPHEESGYSIGRATAVKSPTSLSLFDKHRSKTMSRSSI